MNSSSSGLTEYTLLEPLPLSGSETLSPTVNANNYLSGLFMLAIALAGAIAVLRFIYAGILYMGSDVISSKNEAKGIISQTLFGLGLAASAWLIVALVLPTEGNKLVFNLSLEAEKIQNNTNTPGGGGGGGTSPGCQGPCPYSYTWGNQVITYKDCSSCSKSDSFGLRIKYGIVDGKETMMNTDLGNKLKATQAMSETPGFKISETWPPTSNHANQKQYDGTSVDLSLNVPTNSSIVSFIKNAEANGLKATYEVKTQAEKTNYVNGGVPANKIIVVPRITAEHFSIE